MDKNSMDLWGQRTLGANHFIATPSFQRHWSEESLFHDGRRTTYPHPYHCEWVLSLVLIVLELPVRGVLGLRIIAGDVSSAEESNTSRNAAWISPWCSLLKKIGIEGGPAMQSMIKWKGKRAYSRIR